MRERSSKPRQCSKGTIHIYHAWPSKIEYKLAILFSVKVPQLRHTHLDVWAYGYSANKWMSTAQAGLRH